MNNLHKLVFPNGFYENLFYGKLKLYLKGSWDNKISIKDCHKKFSLLFLTKQQTDLILKNLEEKGLVKIEKSEVVITSGRV